MTRIQPALAHTPVHSWAEGLEATQQLSGLHSQALQAGLGGGVMSVAKMHQQHPQLTNVLLVIAEIIRTKAGFHTVTKDPRPT